MVCSQNSFEKDDNPTKYKSVLTEGGRNHQMFAYCPNVNQRTCGISIEDSTDHKLLATSKKQIVYSKDMRYRVGNESYREMDACYYEVIMSDEMTTEKLEQMSEKANGGEVVINVNFTAMTEMNVYIYGGKSRDSAYENITSNNSKVELNQAFNISAYRGFLIVAYPNKDVETEFAFNYWVSAKRLPREAEPLKPAEWYEFAGETGEAVFDFMVGLAIFMIVLNTILCIVNCWIKYKNKKEGKQMEAD